MSEEELNQQLSTDELKDFAGGLTEAVAQSKTRFLNKYEPKGDLLGKKGKPQDGYWDWTSEPTPYD